MATEYFGSLQQRQLIIEFAIIGYIFLIAGILFFIYIKATPDEVIQDEYFFKVREPNIRKKHLQNTSPGPHSQHSTAQPNPLEGEVCSARHSDAQRLCFCEEVDCRGHVPQGRSLFP